MYHRRLCRWLYRRLQSGVDVCDYRHDGFFGSPLARLVLAVPVVAFARVRRLQLCDCFRAGRLESHRYAAQPALSSQKFSASRIPTLVVSLTPLELSVSSFIIVVVCRCVGVRCGFTVSRRSDPYRSFRRTSRYHCRLARRIRSAHLGWSYRLFQLQLRRVVRLVWRSSYRE